MNILSELTHRFGTPVKKGDRYVWPQPNQGPYVEIHWKPGWRNAYIQGLPDDDPGKVIHLKAKQFKFLMASKVSTMTTVNWAAELRPATSNHLARDYAEHRGLTWEEIEEYCCSHPQHSNLLIFPVYEDGVMVSWHGRQTKESIMDLSKYISPSFKAGCEGFLSTKQTCWGLDRIVPQRPVYVCEGIFDALYFGQGVAVMSRTLTKVQIVKILDRKPSSIVLCIDDEGSLLNKKGVRACRKMIRKKDRKIQITAMMPKKGAHDFGDLVAKGLRFSQTGSYLTLDEEGRYSEK